MFNLARADEVNYVLFDTLSFKIRYYRSYYIVMFKRVLSAIQYCFSIIILYDLIYFKTNLKIVIIFVSMSFTLKKA